MARWGHQLSALLGAIGLGALLACPVALPTTRQLKFVCQGDADCLDGFVCFERVCVAGTADAGIADAARADAPMNDVPMTDAPMTDTPMTDTPMTDAPMTDVPMTDAPITDAPTTDAPMTDAPITDAPTTDAGLGRVDDGVVILYTFEEGSGVTVYDVSGVAPAVDLSIDHAARVTWQTGALEMNTAGSSTKARSGGAPTKLYDSCQAGTGLTVEAWIEAAQLDDEGPGRIVTNSYDGYNRNFTLAQYGLSTERYWAFRLRTTDPGVDDNGQIEIRTRPGTTTLTLTHLVFTHSRGDSTVRGYLEGAEVEISGDRGSSFGYGTPRGGDYSNWNSSYEAALGHEIDFTDRPARDWAGTYHMVAIYCRPLSAVEIQQNFAAGPAAQ